MNVEQIINSIIKAEGGGKFTNDPSDSGGATRWGITERVARENGYTGNMRYLPREIAFEILLKKYWTVPGFYLVDQVFGELAVQLMQFGVIAGPGLAAKHLQRCLNVLNAAGSDWPDISVDGQIGKGTTAALCEFIKKRGNEGKIVILGMVASLQSVHFIELAETRHKDEKFEYGWQLNRAIGPVLLSKN